MKLKPEEQLSEGAAHFEGFENSSEDVEVEAELRPGVDGLSLPPDAEGGAIPALHQYDVLTIDAVIQKLAGARLRQHFQDADLVEEVELQSPGSSRDPH